MWWFTAPKVVFGEDSLEELRQLTGSRALIVTDRVIIDLGHAKTVEDVLKDMGFEIKIFSDVEPDPSIPTIKAGADVAEEFCPDWIIGLGGGSCMDAAKGIWILYERPDLRDTIDSVTPFELLGLREKAKLVLIPTTSGTGSEATWAVVLTDPAEKRKIAIATREVIADLAIVDPRFVAELPPRLTAHTGMDVLTHAVEGFVSSWRNDFSDAMSLRAIQLVFRYLPRAFKAAKTGKKDPEARERMHNAATMGGMAFSNSQIGVAHAMGHSIGAVFKIPHGLAVGLALPYVMEFNASEPEQSGIELRHKELAQALGIDTSELISSIRALYTDLEVPTCLRDAGIDENQYEANLDRLIDLANADTGTVMNPRMPTHEEYRLLYRRLYNGSSVDF